MQIKDGNFCWHTPRIGDNSCNWTKQQFSASDCFFLFPPIYIHSLQMCQWKRERASVRESEKEWENQRVTIMRVHVWVRVFVCVWAVRAKLCPFALHKPQCHCNFSACLVCIFCIYSWTSLYARDRNSKNRLAYNEFAYKKTKDDW